MRAADSDRHAIADILANAYSEGRLNLEEYNERLDAMMKTTTYGELVPFVIDLPDVSDKLPAQLRNGGSDVAVRPQHFPDTQRAYSKGSGPKVGATVAVLGENKRRGNIAIGGNATVVAVLGEAGLDLSRATFTTPTVHITVNAVLGQSRIVVPADAVLTVGVVPILGAVTTPDDLGPTVSSANPPHITVRGVALLGEVNIARADAQGEADQRPQISS